jgi:hypothetical protein
VVVVVDEIFESVFVKYVDEEFWSSDFSFDDVDDEKLLKPKPFCLNWPNKRIGVDVFTSLKGDDVSFSVLSFDDVVVSSIQRDFFFVFF